MNVTDSQTTDRRTCDDIVSVIIPSTQCAKLGSTFEGVTDRHARRDPCTRSMHSMGPDSRPTPDPLSLCHDDINPIVTCFNAVIKIVLKRIFVFLCIY